MLRTTWEDLPAPARAAIERECGQVLCSETPSAGRNSDFTATLHTADGLVFCKGILLAAATSGDADHVAVVAVWGKTSLPAARTPEPAAPG
jgi:hypothetical protein